MDRILIEDMAFYAYHGVHEEEARLGQRFHIDVECRLDLEEAGRSDDVMKTVSYDKIVAIAAEVTTERRFNLIEALAEAISDKLLAEIPKVQSVRIRIRKPSAPIPAPSGYASIEIERSR